jgi:hypothetical protein
MRYFPETTTPVREKIASWALSASVIKKLLDAIDELGKHPQEHLERLDVEENVLRFAVSMPREGNPPMDYLFDFSVLYDADEETLVIHDCDYLMLPSEEE